MNETPYHELTWHQQQARARAWRLRHKPAHIMDYGKPGKTLCGCDRPPVTIDPWHRENPENKPCKRCAAIADKRGLPLSEPDPFPQGLKPWEVAALPRFPY